MANKFGKQPGTTTDIMVYATKSCMLGYTYIQKLSKIYTSEKKILIFF